MISNHNRTSSSFRIIEPKSMPQYQQAQQMPINMPHQIPILTMNNKMSNSNNKSSNISSNSANSLMYLQNNPILQPHHQYQQQQQFISSHHHHHHQQQQQQNHYQQPPMLQHHHQMPIHHQHNQQQSHSHQQHIHRIRNLSDTDSSYIPETTSESGISDLDMSEKCNCCPYGYHIDVDFVTFLQTLGGKNLNKQLKKIQRKRNERLQRSMEYVIDEVEKLRLMNGENTIDYIDSGEMSANSPYQMNNSGSSQHHTYNNQYFRYSNCNNNNNINNNSSSNNPSPNISIPITATTTTTTTSSTPTSRQILIPHTLKKTIHKIDRQINEDQELFKKSSGSLNMENDTARKLFILERGKALAAAARRKSSSLNNSINHQSSSLPPPHERNHLPSNYSHQYMNRPSTATHYNCSINNTYNHLPRRSYSSCAEPFTQASFNNPYLNNSNNKINCASSQVRQVIDARRCSSNRASPVRSSYSQSQHKYLNNSFQKLNSQEDEIEQRRSRSLNKKNNSKSPVQQFYRREIKINLAQPQSPQMDEEEHHMMNTSDQLEELKTTTTTQILQKPTAPSPSMRNTNPPIVSLNPTPLPSEVQEEVLLNLFSCNNSGSISSESSESLVEFDDVETKLKINEVYEKKQQPLKEELKTDSRRSQNQHQIYLEKKLLEMEKKLQRLPELEIKNTILLEEKQLLLKQLKNQLLNTPSTPVPPLVTTSEPAKLYRSIGCSSTETEFKRDAATECRVNTREVGITNKLDEPQKEELVRMQTIITKLRDKLNEQTIIMQQQLVKPVTRDVAVMHVVDKVEEPVVKPELRDVAINHRTEVDDKELIEKHTIITNTYIKEIEMLRIENAKLTTNLEELIKKHSKHVVTRGTHAAEQPILYSVGTNTKKNTTRDVQVMFTPKSRDVSLSTDRFYHTRDVGLMCTLGLAEQQEQMAELLEIKRKYEIEVQERVKQIKSYRDVAIVCNLDFKEQRSVSLGCNLEPVKQMRDVSLKCNLDEEFKKLRDVCIGCHLDVKEQKDACFNVNTIEPPAKPVVKEKRDFSMYVLLEDTEKTQMARELAVFKIPKATRDMAISADNKTRLMDNLLRNQSSCMDEIKTFNRQVNTESVKTRESSCDTSALDFEFIKKETLEMNNKLIAQKEEIEQEKVSLANVNNELRSKLKTLEDQLYAEKTTVITLNERLITEQQQMQLQLQQQKMTQKNTVSTETQVLDCRSIGIGHDQTMESYDKCSINIDQSDTNKTKISVRNHTNHCENASVICTKSETEYEQHKITRTGSNKVTQHETVSMKASLIDRSGNKHSEQSTYSTCSAKAYGSSPQQLQPTIVRNQITIPIYKEDELVGSSTSISPSKTTMNTIIDQFVVVQNSGTHQQTTVSTSNTENVPNEVTRPEKKPKGILKSTSSSTASTGDEASFRMNDSIQSNGEHLPQKKALTFGENEIVEGSLQSEQSGSEISLDESSQNNTVIPNEPDEEEETDDLAIGHEELNESADVYETAITTIENITIESSVSEEESKSRRMKTENIDDMDDYEIQEKLMMNFESESTACSSSKQTISRSPTNESKLKSLKHRELEKQQEDDTNQSNVPTEPTNANKSSIPSAVVLPKTQISAQNKNTVSERFELELELHIACAILNDSLYEPLKADKNKVARALNLIQQDWFKLAAKKDSNPALVEEHLNAFYSRFSNLLLERIVNMADLILNTALHYSVSNGNFEIVNLLLDTKVCDVNAQNKAGGYTSIMLAALVPITNDYERMTLKRLFAEGNVNIKSTDNGQTALMLAVMHGNKETVSLLLEAGSDCNLQDKEGSTALMAACEHGHIEIVRLLLDNTNCDPDIKDNDGETAFDISKKKKRNDIIVLLYAHSSKLRSHHPAIQFSKSRPRIGSNGSK